MKRLGEVAHTCNLSTLGSQGGPITCSQKFKTSLANMAHSEHNCDTPGQDMKKVWRDRERERERERERVPGPAGLENQCLLKFYTLSTHQSPLPGHLPSFLLISPSPLEKLKTWPGAVARACNPCTLGGQGLWIT
ncbi:hypothetical protein AAY473_035847 [Plecturocebus cupreus]